MADRTTRYCASWPEAPARPRVLQHHRAPGTKVKSSCLARRFVVRTAAGSRLSGAVGPAPAAIYGTRFEPAAFVPLVSNNGRLPIVSPACTPRGTRTGISTDLLFL